MNLKRNEPIQVCCGQMNALTEQGVKFSLVSGAFINGFIWIIIHD